jgi:hypothetical protein
MVEGLKWLDVEAPCVLCHLLNVDGQIDLFLMAVLTSVQCMLCEQYSRIVIMFICD